MRCFAVAQLECEALSEVIRAYLENCPVVSEKKSGGICMAAGRELGLLLRQNPELVIFSRHWGDKTNSETGDPIHCGAALIPGVHASSVGARIRTKSAVSYGMSPRDTITLSSINDTQTVVALQRELVTLDGAVLERQELPLKRPLPGSADDLMAAVGGLLLLGVSPERLTG
ncbi:hypothetical protein [Papillibacter cinnamivorans]|uniref:Uncharacterized protein n=1 Tax=Papillibacter cinnamivorans DSM 12816 TaxID=1122930 RepID=A0A1W2BW40_9FIRM|nr:hypothetical protein [Papillibacter cinnamivorans]SMC76748.1 hypothetical protein SAMN02745168_2406 [Papillibacter cinnamivorans DSM 12816]